MKVNPIFNHANFKQPAFKGYLASNNSNLDTHGQNNAIETTLGAFHPNRTGKVYYADPLEVVSDSIREKADYIVYDKEPEFPDLDNKVSRNYFGEERVDYKKLMDNFRAYFYRLEMSDRKTVGDYESNIWKNIDVQTSKEKADYFKSRISDAQYNQETAATCMRMYDEAGDLRYRKEKAEDEIVSLSEEKRNTELALEKTKAELERRTLLDELVTEKIADLEDMQAGYKSLQEKVSKSFKTGLAASDFTLPDTRENIDYNKKLQTNGSYWESYEYRDWKRQHGYDNPVLKDMDDVNEKRTASYRTINNGLAKDKMSEKKELDSLEAKIKAVQERIDFYKAQSVSLKAAISKLKKHAEELPRAIQKIVSDISNRKSSIEKFKAKLIPHFDKMKNYFQSRGVRVIR